MENDKTLGIYWGGADNVMCTGTADVDELISLCLEKSRPPVDQVR